MSPSTSLFSKLVKIVLFILGPLNFCINFMIKKIYSLPAKTSWDFDGVACCAWDIASTLKTGLGGARKADGRIKPTNSHLTYSPCNTDLG